MNIDYLSKDIVLSRICEYMKPEKYQTRGILDVFGGTDLGYETWMAILEYFQRLGFITDLGVNQKNVSLILHIEAIDFLNRGGFYAQEELLKKTLEKLQLEIESLKPSIPEKTETFTSILANIATVFTFLLPR